MIFAHIKFTRKCIQTQILIQMCIDVFAQSGKKAALFTFRSCRLFPKINDAIDAQKQRCDITGNHRLMKRNIALAFFNNINQLVEQNLRICKIAGEMMTGNLISVIKAVGNIRM